MRSPSNWVLSESSDGRILTSMVHRSYMGKAVLLAIFALLMSCFSIATHAQAPEIIELVEEREITVLRTIYHDNTSFTQGLEIHNGTILESTGIWGHSKLRELNQSTGETIKQVELSDEFFAEGITVFEDKIVMLTWKSEVVFVFDRSSFSLIGNYSIQGQGWGICYDGTHLVTSNGSTGLSFRNPETFEVDYILHVSHLGENLDFINELECVGGMIFANVWKQEHIFAINSSSGLVEYTVNASSIAAEQGQTINEVMNGIAYDAGNDAFWITGKNWSKLYLVQFPTGPISDNPNVNNIANQQHPSQLSNHASVFFLSIIFLIIIRSLVYQPSPLVGYNEDGKDVM